MGLKWLLEKNILNMNLNLLQLKYLDNLTLRISDPAHDDSRITTGREGRVRCIRLLGDWL
jgi:hypothetical protein